MPKRAQRKIASFLLIVQLFFSLLAPFSPFISQAAAQEQTSSANFSEFSTNSLGFSLDGNMLMVNSDQNELNYSYYYIYDEVMQNARGQLSTGANALLAGTQSGSDFIYHQFEQMVFKAQRGGVIYSYYLQKQDSGLTVSQILAADSLELTADEQNWLEQGAADDWLVDEETRTAVTAENVELDVEYVFPLNDKVSVTFTQLPAETSVLTIREVVLSGELAEKYGTDTAYDITTEMEDGSFEYDLSLPKPDSVEGDDAEVVYAETEDDLADDGKVRRVETERDGEQLVEVDEDAGVVRARKMEHMTVYVVVETIPSGINKGDEVNDDCTVKVSGSDIFCYDSIQDAIGAASDGDTITVTAGTYDPFKVVGKNNLTIKASGAAIVKGVQVVTTDYGDRDAVVLVDDSTNIVLDGLTIGPNTGKTQEKDYGIIYENSSGEIKDCTVSPDTSGDMASTAIGIWDGSEVTVEDCTVDEFGRLGIFIYNGCTVDILGGSIKGQVYTAEGEVCYGIEVEGVFNDATPGTGSQVTIDGVEIYNCDNTFATGPTYVSGGVYINGWMQYYDEDDSTVAIENCDIHDNYIGVIAIKSPSSFAHSNNIHDNRVYGVESMTAHDDSTAVFDATNNWWGHASGPKDTVSGDNSILDTNPSGTGSAAIGAVKYSPWYKDEGMTTLTSPNAITNNATDKGFYDATLQGTNGDYAATGHSFWVSLAPFDTSSPNIPSNVYSTPDMGSIVANEKFSASLSSLTTNAVINGGVHSNMPAIKPNTTYYYVAWARVGGVWYPGEIQTFTTDSIPVPTLVGPADGTYRHTSDLNKSDWTDVIGPSSPVVYYYESSLSTDTNADGSFTDTAYKSSALTSSEIMNPGEPEVTYYWHVKACDNMGNCGKWSPAWQINIDNTAPNTPLGLYYEANGKVLSCNSFTDSYNITAKWGASTDTNFSHYEYKSFNPTTGWVWNGGNIGNTLSRPGAFTVGEGTYGFAVRAVDKAGNASDWTSENLADSCRITYDKTQPTITDLSVDKNYVKAGDVLTITAEVTDSSGISAVSADFSYSPEYTNRPTPTSVSMTNTGGDIYSVSYSIPSSWNEGIMYVKVAARDYTGENWVRSGETKSVTVDNTAPKSIITTPANDGDNSVVYSNSWNGSVAGTATDSLSGLGKVQLTIQNDENKYWDGTSWQSALVYVEAGGTTDNWTYSMSTSPSQGTYTISSHAVDNAGNMESSYKVTIVLDKTIPQVDLTMDPTDPDGSGSWYITRPTLTLTANDNFEVDFIEYRWSKNGTWTTYANPLKSPSEGTNTLYYRAVDLAGNVSDEGIKTLQWDQTDLTDGPLNVSASPNPTSGSTADVSWDKADDNIGIDKYTITWELRDGDDKHSKEVNGDVTETTISDLLEGTYKITVRAYDNSGHNQSATTDLTVDRTAPAAPALTLDATRDGEVDLSWTEIEDADDYIILYGLESGNHIYAARVGNITSYTVQGLTAGSYYFVVRAVDKADNQSSNSNEVSSGTILGAVGLGAGVGGPAAGFEEAGEVLGEETEAAEQELAEQAPTSDEETGDVLGTATSVGFFQSKLPWIMLGLQALALLIFEAIQRRQQSMLKFAISLGITLVLTGLYYLLRNPEYFAEGSITMMLNNWYWLSAIGIMILIRMIGYGFIEEVEL